MQNVDGKSNFFIKNPTNNFFPFDKNKNNITNFYITHLIAHKK